MEKYVQEQEEKLLKKVIPQNIPEDFREYWEAAVASLRAVPLQVKREKLRTPYDKTVSQYEIRFNTHDATEIVAWFFCPANATEKLPCVVHFHGGSMYKGLQHSIVATGVCCLDIDVRGQGGESLDRADYPMGNLNGDIMTRGLLDKNSFYLRNIYLDAVRTMDVAASLPEVDPERIVTFGGSQGGALSIAASSLSGRSKKCFTFVTSYCCIRERILDGTGVFRWTNEYLKRFPENTDRVFDTMAYFDAKNMVSLLTVPTDFCLGMADAICLPHYVYSAYHHATCEKTMMIVPFAPHGTPTCFRDHVHFQFAAL